MVKITGSSSELGPSDVTGHQLARALLTVSLSAYTNESVGEVGIATLTFRGLSHGQRSSGLLVMPKGESDGRKPITVQCQSQQRVS